MVCVSYSTVMQNLVEGIFVCFLFQFNFFFSCRHCDFVTDRVSCMPCSDIIAFTGCLIFKCNYQEEVTVDH